MAAYESFAEVYDLFMDNVPYDAWCRHILTLLKRYGISDGLLAELGCGTGKMTRLLQKAGFDMIGIDSSCEMLGIAMNQGPSDILYLCQDMRAFELYGTVAAVVSVCDSMNYITEPEDMVNVMKLVNNYLDPGGIFLFDMNTRYKYQELLADRVFAENRDVGSFVWENEYDDKSGINAYHLTLYIREISEDIYNRYEEEHFQRAYTIEEIKAAAETAGMEFVAVYDAETMDEPMDKTERIYIVCREKGKEMR